MRQTRIRLAVLIALVLALALESAAVAEGPWQGRILDGETGEPIEGVIVLAVFYQVSPGFVGHKERSYHASLEAITDSDGRFVIPTLPLGSELPLSSSMVEDPNFYYFKLGYGQWGFKSQNTQEFRSLHPRQQTERSRAMREAFVTEEGAHIELTPAKTRAEQLRSIDRLPGEIPLDRIPLMRAANERARAALGLK